MELPVWARPAGAAAGILAAVGLGYYYLYASPRAAIEAKLAAQQSLNASYESELKDRKRLSDRLKALAATTLGPTAETADPRFRSALNEILSKNGLSGVTVNTRPPQEDPNPAGAAPKFATALRGELKKQKDFFVISGDVEGKGTLEQALKAAAIIQNQPWVHRVESFSIRPEGKERERFTLKMTVATMLMPDLAPKDLPEPQINGADEGEAKRWAAILEKNVFRAPSPQPPVAAAPAPPGPAAAPPPPPYNDWKLTGLIESRLGLEAFLVNIKSGQKMALPVGSAVADARFVSGGGERAVFEIEGQRYEVSNGQTLEQRRPATR